VKLERLRQMRISELAGRSLQEASKRLERMGVAGKRKSRLHAILKKPRSAGTLLNDFQKTAPVHFFEGIEGEQFLAIAAKQMPDFQDSVIAVAETVRHKRFDLLGYRGLYFGDPIDWHLDPISGKRSPRVHWSRIDPPAPPACRCRRRSPARSARSTGAASIRSIQIRLGTAKSSGSSTAISGLFDSVRLTF